MRNSLLFHVQYAKAFSRPEREREEREERELENQSLSLSLFRAPRFHLSRARVCEQKRELDGRWRRARKTLCAVEKCLRKVDLWRTEGGRKVEKGAQELNASHLVCIYAGDVASAIGFGLCRSKMMNGIVALHSPPMRKDAAEKNGMLLRSAGCIGSNIRSSLFTRSFKHVGAAGAPALLLRSSRSLLMLLRRRFYLRTFSSLWMGVLMDSGRARRNFFRCEREIQRGEDFRCKER